jgi:hypothetical protein
MSDESKALVLNPERERAVFLGALASDPDLAGVFGLAHENAGLFGKKSTSAYLTKPQLSFGDSGSAVREVQSLLKISVDGDFGKGTESAVRSFQTKNSIPATGVVSAQTWAALLGEKYKGTTSDIAGRQAKTAQTITDITGLVTQFLPGQQTAVSEMTYEEPEDEGWGWQQYAMVAGGVVFVGAVGFFAYKQFSKD